MKKIFTILAIICIFALTGCTQAAQRNWKSIRSNWGGGLNRTVTLMDYQGDTLKQWTGKFDVRDTGSDNQVYFDVNGKRVWIQGGIVVNEEF